MPFENSQADPAPTRRTSRTRIAADEAATAGATAPDFEDAPTIVDAPLSRRAARKRLNAADLIDGSADVESDVIPTKPEERTVRIPRIPAAPSSDAFETASKAFLAVGHSATSSFGPAASESVSAEAADPSIDEAETSPEQHVVRRRRPSARRFLAIGATVGVMSLAGLMAVSMTLPAEAVAAVQGGTVAAATSLVSTGAAADDDDEIQAFVTSSDVQNESLARSDSFSTVSLIQVAAEEGINYSNEVFTNDTEAAIQWPFKVGVGMSSGYGMRWGRLHEGIDFVPGEGAPIQAIADGVVRTATEQGGAYGVTVYIDHVIDGQVITSHYSHMQYGSLQVKAGDAVKVGDIVGHTGNTGRSYGAHLHFELIINGSTIDPLPWLRENAGRYTY